MYIEYRSFRYYEHSLVVTSHRDLAVAWAINSWGENLVLINRNTGEAIRHGNGRTLAAAFDWMPKKQYRRVRRFLAERGQCVDWVISYEH